MQCHKCSHTLVEKARFCDDCGASAAVADFDAEALKTYCGKCAGMLRGTKKYCIHCGDPSIHSGKASEKREAGPLFKFLTDPRVQVAAFSAALLIAVLPFISPIRYRLSAAAPFVSVYIDDGRPETALLRDRENFRIRPLVEGGLDEPGDKIKAAAGIARDLKGNVYVADIEEHVVYKIDATGKKTRYAGTGKPGYDGDGGPAVQASLNRPRGLDVDDLDGLLIADSGNHVIRRVSAGGYISTVAGEPAGDEPRELKLVRGQDARKAQLMAPGSVTAEIDGTIYVTEDPCEPGPREPTVWVLNPKN